MVSKLLADALDAHGGLDRWARLEAVSADFTSTGALLAHKGVESSETRRLVASTRRQEAQMVSMGGKLVASLLAGKLDVTMDGKVIAGSDDPRASFAGHDLESGWDPVQRAYFGCYAMWSYLTVPFSLAMPGAQVWDVEPLEEDGEVWRGIRAVMPEGIATHSRAQEFYFGSDMILRRQDYTLDISGGFNVANYALDPVEVDGITFLSKRRAFTATKRYDVLRDRVMVALDMSSFAVTPAS